jgi:hypothetical protein
MKKIFAYLLLGTTSFSVQAQNLFFKDVIHLGVAAKCDPSVFDQKTLDALEQDEPGSLYFIEGTELTGDQAKTKYVNLAFHQDSAGQQDLFGNLHGAERLTQQEIEHWVRPDGDLCMINTGTYCSIYASQHHCTDYCNARCVAD